MSNPELTGRVALVKPEQLYGKQNSKTERSLWAVKTTLMFWSRYWGTTNA